MRERRSQVERRLSGVLCGEVMDVLSFEFMIYDFSIGEARDRVLAWCGRDAFHRVPKCLGGDAGGTPGKWGHRGLRPYRRGFKLILHGWIIPREGERNKGEVWGQTSPGKSDVNAELWEGSC